MPVSDQRYETMTYRRCGRSGLRLPAISLGCWNNFGDRADPQIARQMLTAAFDRGITHFDLANNYGPPPGSAETNFGRIVHEDFAGYRDELIISSKAGYPMWPGPYGDGGGRKYLIASCDQSLQRMGLDYVDIFYSHRFDANTPLQETIGALDMLVRQGKALYVGISSYNSEQTIEAARIAKSLGAPLLIHQPCYNMLNRGIEKTLLADCETLGIGVIAFCPLAQGMLSDKYLGGIPADSRIANPHGTLGEKAISDEKLDRIRRLNDLAQSRGQSLAQMALAWVLRDGRVTSALIGASRVEQIDQNVAALANLAFTDDELDRIDQIVSA